MCKKQMLGRRSRKELGSRAFAELQNNLLLAPFAFRCTRTVCRFLQNHNQPLQLIFITLMTVVMLLLMMMVMSTLVMMMVDSTMAMMEIAPMMMHIMKGVIAMMAMKMATKVMIMVRCRSCVLGTKTDQSQLWFTRLDPNQGGSDLAVSQGGSGRAGPCLP